MLGEGIFVQDGPRWKHSREMLRRQFVRMQYQSLQGFGEHTNDLIDGLRRHTGTAVDLQPFFFRFTLATTTALIFGSPVKDGQSETQNAFASNFDYTSLITAIRMRLADFYWAYTPSKYIAACDSIKAYADGFIKQALEEKNEEGLSKESNFAFIKDLFDEYKNPVLVRDQLLNVLIAGRDTTACLLSWTL